MQTKNVLDYDYYFRCFVKMSYPFKIINELYYMFNYA